MSADCAISVASMVDALEYGAKPYPIFFSDTLCGSGQWPPPGESVSEALLNTPFNIRQQTCNQAQGVPAELMSTSSQATIPIGYCPLPIIQSGLIPPGLKITFYAARPPNQPTVPIPSPGPYCLTDPGIYVMNSSTSGSSTIDPMISSNNIFTLPSSATAPGDGVSDVTARPIWGSSMIGPEGSSECSPGDTDYAGAVNNQHGPWFTPGAGWPYDNPLDPHISPIMTNFDALGNQKRSLFSCGMPFWPSLTSVLRDTTTLGAPIKTPDGQSWTLYNRDYFYNTTDTRMNFCHSDSFFASGNPATPGEKSGWTYYSTLPDSDFDICRGHEDPVAFSTGDCTGNLSNYQYGYASPDGSGTLVYGCAGDNAVGDTCSCMQQQQANGSLDRMKIEYLASWEIQQFRYCVGLDTLSVGGIPIQIYGNGTPACDPIVTSLCLNTSFVASDPAYAKSCACILEQQRFNIQFAGLDLPVQCFGSVCSNNDPQVYKTVNQSQGCSARLCSQIITINGSAISAEGYQTMLCDGQTYVVQTTDISPGPVTIIPVTSPHNIQLGIAFYISLGLLAIMILLLVAWGIRKWIVTKRNQKQQQKEVLKSLERLIQK